MANFETDLVLYLRGATPVSSIVGNRIYPRLPDQNPVFPVITYYKVGGERVGALDRGSSGLVSSAFQFDCWSRDYGEVVTLSNAVLSVLIGYQGMMGTTYVSGMNLVSEFDFYEDVDKVRRRTLRMNVWYCEDPIDNIQP